MKLSGGSAINAAVGCVGSGCPDSEPGTCFFVSLHNLHIIHEHTAIIKGISRVYSSIADCATQ